MTVLIFGCAQWAAINMRLTKIPRDTAILRTRPRATIVFSMSWQHNLGRAYVYHNENNDE